jgi:PAS domain S-box-containing protein
MRLGIDKKVNLLCVGVILFLGLLLGYYFIRHEIHALNSELEERAAVLLSSLSTSSEYPILIGDREAISRLVKGVLTQKDVVFCKIEDIDGALLFKEGSTEEKHIREFTSVVVTKRVAEEGDEGMILGALKEVEEEIGKIYLSISLSGLNQKVKNIQKTVTAFVIVTIILASLAISLLLKLILSGPITSLVKGTERIARGDLNYKVPVKSNDEIGMLATSFNQMTQDLSRTLVSKNYIDNIIKSMVDILIVVNPDTTIKTVNQATLDLLGYEESELIRKPIKMIFTGEAEVELWSESLGHDNLVKREFIQNVEKTYLTKDGREIPVLFSCSPMYDVGGKIEGIVCVAQDITERKRAEEEVKNKNLQLQRINKELEDFTYIVSHDLKSPLVNLQGFSARLSETCKETKKELEELSRLCQKLDGKEAEEKIKEILENLENNVPLSLEFIKKSISKMDALIKSILDLSRISTRRKPLECVDLNLMLKDIINALEYQIQEKNIQVKTLELPQVYCEKERINQVFSNLLSNAINYIGENPRPKIEVGYEDKRESYQFYVKDNGIGIEEKHFNKIFQLFKRVGEVEVKGDGMGLAYVKKIIQQHQGEIWVESKKYQGSTFYFTLPKKEVKEDARQEICEYTHSGG